jgi:uncharacterized protein YoxC
VTDHSDASDTTPAESESVPTPTNGADDRIESRLRAVERAVTGSDARPADVAAAAEATAERERLESRIDDLEERVAELEAATQAVRGYVGSVRAVNREVERRADLALARATTANRDAGDADASDEGAGVSAGDDQGTRPDGAAGSGRTGAVPSESALDAALPDDRPSSRGRGGKVGESGGLDSAAGGSDGDGDAWATEALDRLRESL